jgi:hypothetical protein
MNDRTAATSSYDTIDHTLSDREKATNEEEANELYRMRVSKITIIPIHILCFCVYEPLGLPAMPC